MFNNNAIVDWRMSCLMVGQDQGLITRMRITNNWLDGGSATINLNSKGKATLKSVITDNRFGRGRTNTS